MQAIQSKLLVAGVRAGRQDITKARSNSVEASVSAVACCRRLARSVGPAPSQAAPWHTAKNCNMSC